MDHKPLPRLDLKANDIRKQLIRYSRLSPGEIWNDPDGRHLVACGDATDSRFVRKIFDGQTAVLAILDPPYNMVMFEELPVEQFIDFCRKWVDNCSEIMAADSSMYVWMGADQNNHFQPLAQFITMMADSDLNSRSFISLRNQRGYGTQKNWMSVRQELLYYTRGKPPFDVQYTDIPKILRGYYKEVGGSLTDNLQRGRSPNIRPGNIWVDIQQVFYRMQENVSGCFGQKPLKAVERIIEASSSPGDLVTDFFSHSGSTLLACERTGRTCITFDIDPIFTEITIRRLEHFRRSGKTGWQNSNPFAEELVQQLGTEDAPTVGAI